MRLNGPRLARATGAVGLTLLALVLAGCHKGAKAKYQPPPPPYSNPSRSGTTSAGRRPVPGFDRPDPDTAKVTPTRPLPDPHGKPIETEIGLASWYGPPYAGRKGADGTIYDQNAMTAAHLTLPMGTVVRVTNLSNDQSVVVKITDRGPFVRGRIIDLSLAAAKATGVYRAGVTKVRVEAFSIPPPATSSSGTTLAKVIPGGRWCVQIGAFMTQEDAVSLKNDLIRRYTTAKVTEFAGPTGHWVRINPKFPDKGTAEQVAQSIHVPDAEPYLIRMD